MNADLLTGLASLFDAYMRISERDRVLLLYTSDAVEAVALVSAGLSLRRISHRRVWMHAKADSGLEERWNQGLAALQPITGGSLVILTLERDTFSNAPEISRLMSAAGHADMRLFRVISACPALFETAMRANPADLSALNTTLIEAMIGESRLRLTTPSGSDLQVTLDPRRYRWISNRGTIERGRAVVLPAGEVATFPARIDGQFVADFAFNINCLVEGDARLNRHPVRIDIEDSRVIGFDCADRAVSAMIEEVLAADNGRRIGELGFGTNPCVARPVALNSHINERHRGIHLGIGQHNQSADLVPWYCAQHLDLIADGGAILLESGRRIDLATLRPSARPHHFGPQVSDEDVFSPEEVRVEDGDCCGAGEICWAPPAAAHQSQPA